MDQQNMPGVTDSYPSWIRKTTLSLETILRDRRFKDLSALFKYLGRSHHAS
jgi:4-alpha-glucanotransferase